MEEQRKSKPWSIWIVVALVLPVVYVLSAGPLHWVDCQGGFHPVVRNAIMTFYTPLQMLSQSGPKPVRVAIEWYSDLWTP